MTNSSEGDDGGERAAVAAVATDKRWPSPTFAPPSSSSISGSTDKAGGREAGVEAGASAARPAVRIEFGSARVARQLHDSVVALITDALADMGDDAGEAQQEPSTTKAQSSDGDVVSEKHDPRLTLLFFPTHYEDLTGMALVNNDPNLTNLYRPPAYERACADDDHTFVLDADGTDSASPKPRQQPGAATPSAAAKASGHVKAGATPQATPPSKPLRLHDHLKKEHEKELKREQDQQK